MAERIAYQRGKFTASLPPECRYTASHWWLLEESAAVWRIGITQFAAWVLGEPVEFAFSVSSGAPVTAGQEIGWMEGLKSVNTIYALADGEFLGAGEEVSADVTLLDADPLGRGWLYRVRGEPPPGAVDVHAYITMLDQAVRLRQENCEHCAG